MNVNACQSVLHFCPTMAAKFLEQMHCAVSYYGNQQVLDKLTLVAKLLHQMLNLPSFHRAPGSSWSCVAKKCANFDFALFDENDYLVYSTFADGKSLL